MKEVIIKSEKEMLDFGFSFGEKLLSGSVIALVGDLGAGKTHFCQGVCQSFGYLECTSPTFTLVNELVTQDVPVFHFDFYRMKTIQELWEIGWEEYLDKEGIILAEWADLFPEAFPENTIWIKITHNDRGRKLTIIFP